VSRENEIVELLTEIRDLLRTVCGQRADLADKADVSADVSAKSQTALERRRQADRERKRAKRALQKNGGRVCGQRADIADVSADNPRTPSPSFPFPPDPLIPIAPIPASPRSACGHTREAAPSSDLPLTAFPTSEDVPSSQTPLSPEAPSPEDFRRGWAERVAGQTRTQWVLCGVEFGEVWVRWLCHAHERHGRALSLVALGEHLAILLERHKAGGMEAVREAVLWSTRNNCRFPEAPAARRGEGKVVAFEAGAEEAKLRGQWLSFARGVLLSDPSADVLARLREVNPALAARIPATWAGELHEAQEG
jgi:hypothetical protein